MHFQEAAIQAAHQENWGMSNAGADSQLFLASNHHVFKNGLQVVVWFAPRYGSKYEKVVFSLRDDTGDLWLRDVDGQDPDLALLPITMKAGQLSNLVVQHLTMLTLKQEV